LKALVDTSFLLLIVEVGKDLFSVLEDKIQERIEPVVIKPVFKELESISKRRGRRAQMARAAIQLTARMSLVDYPASGSVDETLLKYAFEEKLPIITADRKMVRVLTSSGLPYITINRSGKPIVRLKLH